MWKRFIHFCIHFCFWRCGREDNCIQLVLHQQILYNMWKLCSNHGAAPWHHVMVCYVITCRSEIIVGWQCDKLTVTDSIIQIALFALVLLLADLSHLGVVCAQAHCKLASRHNVSRPKLVWSSAVVKQTGAQRLCSHCGENIKMGNHCVLMFAHYLRTIDHFLIVEFIKFPLQHSRSHLDLRVLSSILCPVSHSWEAAKVAAGRMT